MGKLGNPLVMAAAAPLIQQKMQMDAQKAQADAEARQARIARGGLASLSAGQIIAIAAVTGGALYVGYKVVTNALATAKEKGSVARSDDFDNPASYALRFRQAMDGLGTDEESINDLATAIPDQAFLDKVKAEYRKQTHGKQLLDDLRSELTASEFRVTLAILAHKPGHIRQEQNNAAPGETLAELTQIARDVFFASDGMGTDEEGIFDAVRQLPTVKAWRTANGIYKDLYGYDMYEEFLDELSGDDLQTVFDIAKEKPDYNVSYGISKNIR